jgi:transcriptional antiterminator NusG
MTPDPRFEEGDVVRIKSGPFNAFAGRVREVDESRFVLKVLVSIFGRSQPVELGFTDVEKLSSTEEE